MNYPKVVDKVRLEMQALIDRLCIEREKLQEAKQFGTADALHQAIEAFEEPMSRLR